ncbi:hypothetical protein [Halosolutus gelatinilyticus]|uniref:hypothetical protein n=1 Tax=Halosolutus gelatinilyticus TaxID=2931975 RepID=UPI001FF1F6DD|nr:hypothetical protein [Halosolutus gelatinilyticus]
MGPETTSDQSPGDRVMRALSRVHDTYDSVADRVRRYTPYLVRTIEVALAIALLAALAHWIHWVYIGA